mmetsp:Transcript_13973/g.22134  ORF Transcript_13973/g.22134 Transcript_13973/m.22134 type:complete len:535 (-) Transcript_13973:866-2470(-)
MMILVRVASVLATVAMVDAFQARSLEDVHSELWRMVGNRRVLSAKVLKVLNKPVHTSDTIYGMELGDEDEDSASMGVLKGVSVQARKHGSSLDVVFAKFIDEYTQVNGAIHRSRVHLAKRCLSYLLNKNQELQAMPACVSDNVCVKLEFNGNCFNTDQEQREHSSIFVPQAQPENSTTGRRMSTYVEERRLDVPDKINWLEQGYIGEPENQGEVCGACWAFSSMATIEARLAIRTKRLFTLSAQQLISCYTEPVTRPGKAQRPAYGCTGGNFADVFYYYALQNIYVNREAFMFTESASTPCTLQGALNVSRSTGYNTVGWDFKRWQETGSDGSTRAATNEQIRAALEQGPVSVAMYRARACFLHYKSGILSRESCGEPPQTIPFRVDHAISIVGYENYGSTDPKNPPAWIIKNSWGTEWGEGGFARLKIEPEAGPKPDGTNDYGLFSVNLQVAWPDEATLDAACASSSHCLAQGQQIADSPTVSPTGSPTTSSPTGPSPTSAPTKQPTKESTASTCQSYAMLTSLLVLVAAFDY